MKVIIRIGWVVLAAGVCACVLDGCSSRNHNDEVQLAQGTAPPAGPEQVPERFRVTITPQAEDYEIPRDLGNVRNLDHYAELTSAQKRRLAELGFVVVPDDAQQMFMLYEDYAETSDAANFITVDSLLQAYHVFFDFSLRSVEEQHLAALARQMTDALLSGAQAQLAPVGEGALREAGERNLAYLAVAARLLEPAAQVPAQVGEMVSQELALIEAHELRAESPVMGSTVQYTQFNPRGHYTRSEELGRYFRAMMWYGLVGFNLETGDAEVDRRQTLQALLLTKLLAEDASAREAWERLYGPIEFFVGGADDLSYADYLPIAQAVFGAALPLEELASTGKLEQFMARAREQLPAPQIAPFFYEADAAGNLVGEPKVQGRQMRVLGQRFIPDSWVLQQLVSPLVGEPGPDTARDVPMGLDVMAALGSARARQILTETYHQDRYANYEAQLDKVAQRLAQTDESTWRSNLYWGWLYSLMPLLEPKGEGYPPFMRSEAWLDKQLSTALSSWAELRHDTILYAKQSGAEMGAGPAAAPKGYVEPYPEVFARLAWLAWRSREGLAQRDLLPERLAAAYSKLEDVLLFLKAVAEKELTNQPRSAEEYERIQYFGGELERLTLDVVEGGESVGHWFEIQNETDRNLACIADVHSFWDQVLQAGVGPAYRIYVVVPHPDGGLQIARGGCFSYWEFPWPAADRLTDEKWQALLASGQAPPQPQWTESFILAGRTPLAQ
ncbi:MAG: DUF3160 domain-containing protein [Armatimonadota bacterium]